MNINCEYYLFKIKVNEHIIKSNSKVKILFSNMVLYSAVDNLYVDINNRNYFTEISQDKKTILLYIENSLCNKMDRIDYLFDDDYELYKHNIKVYYNDEEIVDFQLSPTEQVLGKDIYNDFLFGFLSEQFVNDVCSFNGLRPDKLYGYALTDNRYQQLADIIRVECINLIENFNINTFVGCGTLGMDTIAFFAVEYLKSHGYPNLKNILAVPFKKHYCRWASTDIDRYNRMLKLADYVILVDTMDGYENDFVAKDEYHIYKFNKCKEFIVDFSSHIITLWDKKEPNVHACIAYSEYKKRNIHYLSNVNGVTSMNH